MGSSRLQYVSTEMQKYHSINLTTYVWQHKHLPYASYPRRRLLKPQGNAHTMLVPIVLAALLLLFFLGIIGRCYYLRRRSRHGAAGPTTSKARYIYTRQPATAHLSYQLLCSTDTYALALQPFNIHHRQRQRQSSLMTSHPPSSTEKKSKSTFLSPSNGRLSSPSSTNTNNKETTYYCRHHIKHGE